MCLFINKKDKIYVRHIIADYFIQMYKNIESFNFFFRVWTEFGLVKG